MKKYNALIVDDEQGNRELLGAMLLEHCSQIGKIATVKSVAEAENYLQSNSVDVVFLDIEMPHENGFDLLKKLSDINFKVIFVTAYDAYALQAIKYSALDYILKPVDKDELIQAVKKLDAVENQNDQLDLLNHNLTHNENRRIALSTQNEVLFTNVSEIIRLEADANYTKVYLENDAPLTLSGNLGYFEKLLNEQQFYRTHQSHLINLKHVKKFVKTEGGYFVMNSGAIIPISRMKREEVKRLIL